MDRINIGLIGGGTVGGGVFHALESNGCLLSSRLGIQLRVAAIAVRDLQKARAVKLPAHLLTTNWRSVLEDARIQMVVELIGGISTARTVVLAALKLGKPVITANKALISAHGEELFAAAAKYQSNLYYEASVAGGIPIIKVLREGLIGNQITRIYGIVNGTCNYILTRMKLQGADFASALSDAQRLGYAEADSSLDIEGTDAAHKIGILASLASGFWVNPAEIYVEGIRNLSQLDVQFAAQLGYTIKLLGIVKRIPSAQPRSSNRVTVQVAVYPTLIPDGHVLASVNYVYNAISIRGDIAGDTLYYGRGAGQEPTASAVLSDLADAALDLKWNTPSRLPRFVPHEQDGEVLPIQQAVFRYYVRLTVIDRPGTLAKVAAIFAQAHIGISSVIQPEGHEGESVPLILMIHDAPNAALVKALVRIARLNVIKGPPVMLRVETFE